MAQLLPNTGQAVLGQLDFQDNIHPERYDPGEALKALEGAFKKGLVSVSDLNDLFTKGVQDRTKVQQAREDYDRSKAEQGLISKSAEAKRIGLDSDIEVKPLETRKAVADLEIAKREQGIKANLLAPADEAVKRDPTGRLGYVKLLQQYEKAGYGPPRTRGDGTINFDSMQEKLIEGGHYDGDGGAEATDLDKKIASKMVEQGQDTTGHFDKKGRALPSAAGAVADYRQPLTPLQELEETTHRGNQEALLARLLDAEKLISEQNVVGPIVGHSWNPSTWILAAAGSPERQNAQRQLTMIANELIAEKTRDLKGALSNKELDFLKMTIPGLNSDEKVWEKFIKEKVPLLRASIAKSKLATGIIDSAGAAGGRPDGRDGSRNLTVGEQETLTKDLRAAGRVVTDAEGYKALPRGYYVNSRGELGFK